MRIIFIMCYLVLTFGTICSWSQEQLKTQLFLETQVSEFNELPQVQTLTNLANQSEKAILKKYGATSYDELFKIPGIDYEKFERDTYNNYRNTYYESKKLKISKNLEDVLVNSDLQSMFFLAMTSNKQNMDIFFNNPKWYENPSGDYQKRLLEDLKVVYPDIKRAMELASNVLTDTATLDSTVGRRVYGTVCFWLGKTDEGKRMLDELLSIANGTYKGEWAKFNKYQNRGANIWVNLNDVYLGTQGINYENSSWYVENLDKLDPSLKSNVEIRIKFGSWITKLALKAVIPYSQEDAIKMQSEIGGCGSVGGGCGGSSTDTQGMNSEAVLPSSDRESSGACGCSGTTPDKSSIEAEPSTTQAASGSCCQ